MLDELFAGCVTALLAGCAAEDEGAAADDAGCAADEESSLDEEMDGFTEDAGVVAELFAAG